MRQLRLTTYNIHMGLSPFRKRNVVDAIGVVLEDTNADILCVQEDLQVDDVSKTQIAIRCAEVWGNSIFGKTVVHPRGVQGNSIISRYPIRSSGVVKLPRAGGQERSLVRSTIEVEAGLQVDVICAHFGLTRRQRLAQSKATIHFLQKQYASSDRLIVAGDFNDWQGDVSAFFKNEGQMKEARMDKTGARPRTFPAWFPLLPLDRIFYRNCQLSGARVFSHAGRLDKSDHLPIIADFLI